MIENTKLMLLSCAGSIFLYTLYQLKFRHYYFYSSKLILLSLIYFIVKKAGSKQKECVLLSLFIKQYINYIKHMRA